MARGAHAAPKRRGPVVTAARRALLTAGAFSGAFALTWAGAGVVSSHGYVDAFAAEVGGATASPADQARKIDTLAQKYDCSTDGLGPDVIPARTVVVVDGEVRLATFDEGWAIHLGDVPGTLVSVCAK